MQKPPVHLFLLDLRCPECLCPYTPAADLCVGHADRRGCGARLPAHPEPPREK